MPGVSTVDHVTGLLGLAQNGRLANHPDGAGAHTRMTSYRNNRRKLDRPTVPILLGTDPRLDGPSVDAIFGK